MKLILALLVMVMSVYAQNTREYYVSGKLRLEGTINDHGSKVGTWNEFYENGRLKSTTQYKYNKIVSEIKYGRKGTIEHELRYDGDYISYEKTPTHTTEYVKGIVRYIDGVSQWSYQCDNIVAGNTTKTLCGYATLLGSRVGYWKITSSQPENDIVKSATRYAVYDTTRSTTLLYLKDEVCFNNGAGCTIGITKSTEHTLYYYDSVSDSYKFNNSLSWTNNHTRVFSSGNRSNNLTMDNCDNQEYMPNKVCIEHVKYKYVINIYEELFTMYK